MRRAPIITVLVATFLLVSSVFMNWRKQLSCVDKKVRPHLSSVLVTYHKSRITGGQWQDKFLEQSQILRKHPPKERVEFYRGVLLNCSMESANAMTFVNAVGDDIKGLHEDLLELRNDQTILSATQKTRLGIWLDELKIMKEINYPRF